ncbi:MULTISPECIES: glycosyltransferase family 2 protein [Protofrankia]|uniref:glycosyltransferase family 2 protein n=1 Tax=Protofrankia TaxID=2994361 RepID=UPI001F1DB6F0|nr:MULTISPECIES: glycosyltransferase family 2 protein [Protofrankia]
MVVVDSGSTDGTPDIARMLGATVWEEPWRGFAGQREWAMRHPDVRHDWVYFLDADEWVPVELAKEIAERLGREDCVAYAHRYRFFFLGRWMAHCGWYTNSWQARLLDRRFASFATAEEFSERASVRGTTLALEHDIVNQDSKGLASWLHKHIAYAELEARRRGSSARPFQRLRQALVDNRTTNTRPLSRTIARDIVFPLLPFKTLAIFFYMYVFRSGWRDGWQGLAFCLHRAWHEKMIHLLGTPAAAPQEAVYPFEATHPRNTLPSSPSVIHQAG